MLKKLMEMLELDDGLPMRDALTQPILFGGDVTSFDALTGLENSYGQIFALIPDATKRTPFFGPPPAANENLSFEDILMADIFPSDILH